MINGWKQETEQVAAKEEKQAGPSKPANSKARGKEDSQATQAGKSQGKCKYLTMVNPLERKIPVKHCEIQDLARPIWVQAERDHW